MKRNIIFLAALVVSIACHISCEREQKKPKIFEYQYRNLHVGEITSINGENLEGIEWSPNDFFVAEVDGLQRIVPKHVGATQIFGYGGLMVEVKPKFTDYDLPVIYPYYSNEKYAYDGPPIWGDSPSGVRMYETRTRDSRSTNSLLVYKTGNTKSPYVVYYFTDMKLQSSGTLIDPRNISNLTNLADFLQERYIVFSIDLTNYTAYFYHQKGSKDSTKIDYSGALQYSKELGGLLLIFMPNEESKAYILQDQMEAFVRQLEEILTQ